MGRLAGFDYRKCIKKLKKLGFEFDRNALVVMKSGGILLQGLEQQFLTTLVNMTSFHRKMKYSI